MTVGRDKIRRLLRFEMVVLVILILLVVASLAATTMQ